MWLKNIFPKSDFTRNVLLIGGGTVFAQVANILLSPIVTRLYTPEDFGIFSVYSSILSLSTIASSLKYELAIPIAEDDETAVNIIFLCLIILIGYTFFFAIALSFAGGWITTVFHINNFNKFNYYLPLGVFLIGLYVVVAQWAFRKKDYKSISKTKYTQSISQNIIKIGLGFLQFKYSGLLLGLIVGESAGITTLSVPFLKKYRYLLKRINLSKIKHCMRKYINFSTLLSISFVFNALGLYLMPLFIAYLYDETTVGYYGLAHSVISLPVNAIGASIGNVFYGEIAGLGKTKMAEIKQLMFKLSKQLCLLGVIPLIIVLFFGPFLFSLVFGEQWHEAGIYARIMAVFIFFRFVFSFFDRIFSVFERQREQLILDLLRIIFIFIIFFLSKLFLLNSYFFIGLYSVVMSIIYILTFVVILKIFDNGLIAHIVKK